MSKTKDKHEAPALPPREDPPQLSGCVVCGQYTGDLSETVGAARWHKACGEARPDVIAKVKARA